MSSRSSSFGVFVALAALLALSGLSFWGARAGEPGGGRSIRFSEPKSDEIATNLNQLTSRKDSLKPFDEDIHQTFQSLFPAGSLDGVPAAPIPPPSSSIIQSKRVKELLEKRRNRNDYLWMTPEDMMTAPTLEEILKVPEYGPDGQEKKKETAFDRYYERLEKKPAPRNSASSSFGDDDVLGVFGKPSPRQGPGERDDLNLPPELKNSAQALKRLFEEDSDNKGTEAGAAPSSQYADVFGFGNPTASREKDLNHKRVMDEFRTILDPNWRPAAGLESSVPFGDSLEPARPTVSSSPAITPSVPMKAFDDALTPAAPITAPQAPADPTVQALKAYQPTPVLPKTDAPKTAPPRPTFEFPRRPGI